MENPFIHAWSKLRLENCSWLKQITAKTVVLVFIFAIFKSIDTHFWRPKADKIAIDDSKCCAKILCIEFSPDDELTTRSVESVAQQYKLGRYNVGGSLINVLM
jgi:hypothetical protein